MLAVAFAPFSEDGDGSKAAAVGVVIGVVLLSILIGMIVLRLRDRARGRSDAGVVSHGKRGFISSLGTNRGLSGPDASSVTPRDIAIFAVIVVVAYLATELV